MKKIIYSLFIFSLAVITSCGDGFLEKEPLGAVGESQLATRDGVDALLIGAYSVMDGVVEEISSWDAAGSNYVYGSIASDDAYKGSDEGDQVPQSEIEVYSATPALGYFNNKWRTIFDAVSRCNDVIRVAGQALDAGSITQDEYDQYLAQAKALRAHYHFEGKIVFSNIPYIEENVGLPDGPSFAEVGNIDESGNYIDAWPKIVQDLKDAIAVLPVTKSAPGRISKWTAKGMLVRAYMHWNGRAENGIDATSAPGYTEVKTLMDDIIENGPFELVESYHDNFRISGNNNSESILEAQASVNDGTDGQNGNWGDALNYPYGPESPGTCCGFHQPSQNLVNAYLTDPATGLPFLDNFNSKDFRWDQGLDSYAKWESKLWYDPDFVPYGRDNANESIDPRLDWVVGRRGIPYLDWALHPGFAWIRKQAYAGPYSPKKNVYYRSEKGALSTASGWAQGPNANNIRIIRLPHIMLWRAEVAAMENDLGKALNLVNELRERASNDVVMARDTSGVELATPACLGYNVKEYTAFPDQAFAIKAIRHEARLEFGMEGNRFFDLVRWGIAASTLNNYLQEEATRPIGSNVNPNVRDYLAGKNFTSGRNERYPIPQDQIDIMGSTVLKQNPNW
ncbi:MAG: RagB/SusD family nutrient uptake outer membrane protein [Cyclobacteriaceae bacterium]|nr:RagB/SusD family nutrient uptake outer membrane protein [Cyclobacteriaceae bacterium]